MAAALLTLKVAFSTLGAGDNVGVTLTGAGIAGVGLSMVGPASEVLVDGSLRLETLLEADDPPPHALRRKGKTKVARYTLRLVVIAEFHLIEMFTRHVIGNKHSNLKINLIEF